MFIEFRIPRGVSDRQSRACIAMMFVVLGALPWNTVTLGEELAVTADLLVVGGTESGCAAAVQAARMGVQNIVLVNDIEWLGGQFSAEGLGAIDENRAHGYDGSVPIPRSGIFREVIDAIEQRNAELYGGVRRPGNTRVITTSRPVVSERVFRRLLKPFEDSKQLVRYSNYRVSRVDVQQDILRSVTFESVIGGPPLTVTADVTIDASDWGDVIKGAGAEWEAGVDARAKYDEPSAPESVNVPTDMNPITWCMILKQTKSEQLLPMPKGYSRDYFNGIWGWFDEEFAYSSRRLVDGAGFEQISHPDIVLVNCPAIDYPVDVFSRNVVDALEATEEGASQKNIVAMTTEQREIVFQDARSHSLKYFYHLQQRFPRFRSMALSDEFGTKDRLPPKPYIRESLRLKAQHIVTESEVLGFGGRSNYATTMFPDAVFCWQFEMDFHPTARSWTTEDKNEGPWEATFRGNRRFGRGGTGRCVFPLRSLIPTKVKRLLGGQKNLGYTSIVGSSCRLHDQSIHVGQASGAVAAVCLRHREDPDEYYLRPNRMAEVWTGLLEPSSGAPMAIWPFSDVDPFDPGFSAIQQLALRRLLTSESTDTAFGPDEPATPEWIANVVQTAGTAGYEVNDGRQRFATEEGTRRAAAIQLWKHLSLQATPSVVRRLANDADADGIHDSEDPLPFTPGVVSWQVQPEHDGVPDEKILKVEHARAFNFTSASAPEVDFFVNDVGNLFDESRAFGWSKNLLQNTRLRRLDHGTVRDGFVFTRQQDIWECAVGNGLWMIHGCLGDIGHDQPGQNLQIEETIVAQNIDTSAGQFWEFQTEIQIDDGRLTLTLGKPNGGSNTCINWLVIAPVRDSPSK